MGCSSCAGAAAAAATQYPKEITMPDGTKKTVTSSADEKTERARFQQREREIARTKGYTVRK